ncbi:NAD(P)/FAD-dependent oxidoreductase [Gordonia sp. AC31]|uniref:flavin-containing monooxygenase n=1 Tax=Gordonia sp. AC31 TaxID=2962571 RepID=UPI002880BE3B|nr:NAD(P)/FAD-dependent oxidoreductase [Gordonia sp. AC31]MDT0223882.1 NAD(P)/FAD-dependent oxidoreductase [Gordonia sp. AC31]
MEGKTSMEKQGDGVLDALVVGLGITGIYQLHKLNQAGLQVRAVEAGSGVGGTWFWNRYPGARFDSESYLYAYFASEDLYKRWRWSEHYAGQPEIEAYLNEAVREFELTDLISLDTRVEAMEFDAERAVWNVRTNRGETITTRFVVPALGFLSRPLFPEIPGRDSFAGPQYHTGLWPDDAVDLTGKRVGIIGVGSSGVQLATEIADRVEHLTIFQRHPNWCTPLNNSAITDEEHAEIWDSFEDYHQRTLNSYGGFLEVPLEEPGAYAQHTPARRREMFDHIWKMRGSNKFFSNYPEVGAAGEANKEFCDYMAEQIRARVNDPETAELLIPDHAYGAKRPPFESGFYEIFNQPNVTLVSTLHTPIERITESGVSTTDGDHELDVLIFATGFRAVTGSYDAIDIRANGKKLTDQWADGPQTYLGIITPGFPNMLNAFGPQSPGGNAPRCAERICDFIADLVIEARRRDVSIVDAPEELARDYTDELAQQVAGTIYEKTEDWRSGSNIPGKKQVYMFYQAGLSQHTARLNAVEANGFEGFVFA